MNEPNLPDAPYVSTYLGNRFYPAAPRIEDVHIEDIAHGLAFQCRFNGQTRSFYSVAQHSLFVAALVPTRLKLAALLHDAAEAYLGDMVKPLKLRFPEFARLETEVMALIGQRFGVTGFDAAAIKRADLIALATEKRDLMPHSSEAWASLAGVTPVPARIVPMPPHEAKAAFLERFHEFGGGVIATPAPRNRQRGIPPENHGQEPRLPLDHADFYG